MFWERFKSLCDAEGIKPNALGKKIGIGSATITQWKQGSDPSTEKLQQIATYFNVSSDYLLGTTDNTQSAKSDIEPEMAEAIKLFTNLPPDKRALALKIIKVFAEE